MRLMTLLIAGCACLCQAANASDLETRFESGDYPAFFRQAEPLAEQGDAEAAFLLGKAHHLGRGVAVDTEKARAYYQRAAAGNNARAEHNLGVLDLDETQRPDLARKHFQRALALGLEMPTLANLGKTEQLLCGQPYHGDSCHAAGEAYLRAWQIDGNNRYLDEAVVGFAAACFRQRQSSALYGQEYKDKEADCPRAMALAEQGANLGLARATFNRGALEDNAGHPESALPWFTLAAERKLGLAAHTLGEMFEQGRGGDKDEALAQDWYRRGAELQYEPSRQHRQAYLIGQIRASVEVTRIEALMGEWQALDAQHRQPEEGKYRLELIRTLADNATSFPRLGLKSLPNRLCVPTEELYWNTEWRIFAVRQAEDSIDIADALPMLAQGRTDKGGCALLSAKDQAAILNAIAAGKTPMLNWPGQRRLLAVTGGKETGKPAALVVGLEIRY
jgi:TPR repeat protein